MASNKFKFTIDDSGFQKILDHLDKGLQAMAVRGMVRMADTLLTLSRMEVPHDVGTLSKHGSVFNNGINDIGVAYNIEYAAYQHEGGDGKRIIKHYQKGRKGKYLEDPMKLNLSKWMEMAGQELADQIQGA